MRIEVVTTITTTFVVSDNGYTSSMTLPEVDKWAKDRLNSIQLYIREGATEPRPVSATFTLEQVIFTPDKKR